MQYHDETARLVEIDGCGPEPFARYLAALAEAQGEAVVSGLTACGTPAVTSSSAWRRWPRRDPTVASRSSWCYPAPLRSRAEIHPCEADGSSRSCSAQSSSAAPASSPP